MEVQVAVVVSDGFPLSLVHLCVLNGRRGYRQFATHAEDASWLPSIQSVAVQLSHAAARGSLHVDTILIGLRSSTRPRGQRHIRTSWHDRSMSTPREPPRIEYDEEANAAYIYLTEEILAGGVSRTVCVDPTEIGGMVNLDLDAEGRIIGLEVLDARQLLPRDILPT